MYSCISVCVRLSEVHSDGDRSGSNQHTSAPVSPSGRPAKLLSMIDTAAVCGETPDVVLADAGYGNERDLKELEDRGMDAYVALGREGKAVAKVDPEEYPARARMREKMASEDGRRRYARRKWLSEAPNGWIKEAMGFRRFSFRGLEKVRAEWALVCLALNVKRLHGLKTA